MSGDDLTEAAASVELDPPNALSSRRLEAFSDGVFAIAATLLVLDLNVSKLGLSENMSSAQIWSALGDHWIDFLSFALSFVLLGLLWEIHVRQFEFVDRVDGRVLTLNTFRLLGVVLIPFTTVISDEFTGTVPGRVLLPLNFFYVVTVTFLQWWYVSSASRDYAPRLSPHYRWISRRNALVAVIVGAAVVVASIWIGSFAFFLFFVGTGFDIADRRAAKREPGRHPRRERRHPAP